MSRVYSACVLTLLLCLLLPATPARGQAGFARVVLFATNSIRLKNRATVTSGDVVVNAASAGPTLFSGYELELDPDASTPAGYALKADSVRLKNNAVAGGDVAYDQLWNQGTIQGNQSSPLALPVFDTLPPFYSPAPAPGAADVAVAPGGSAMLTPGEYGGLTIGDGGTLRLSGGIYDVRSIAMGAGSHLLFAAPSQVRVAASFFSDRGAEIGPDVGVSLAAHNLVFYVAGPNGPGGGLLTTPLAAELGEESRVQANFYVPNGTLALRQRSDATGAFLARDLLVENQAHVALDSFFFNLPPVAVDDQATVGRGGTVAVLDSGATSLLANDSDPNGDSLTLDTVPVSGPAHGTLTLSADGTFSYTHDGGDSAEDSFVYQVCDSGAPTLCATATVSIAVVPDFHVTMIRFGLGDGRVTSTPAGIDCGTVCEATFPGGSGPITLTAEAFGSSFFRGFSGDPDCADGILSPGADKVCYARFDASPVLASLSVQTAGTGSGRVTSAPAGIDCPGTCTAGFPVPTRVELTPAADPGSAFAGWSGDADCEDGMINLFGDTTCVATFEPVAPPPPSFTLTVRFLGNGSGTVTSNPAGVVCDADCSVSFAEGTALTLFIRPLTGDFLGWSGDCTGTSPSSSLILDGDKVCTVTLSQ